MKMLHLGCGQIIHAGWLNIDLEPGPARQYAPTLRHDLSRGLPASIEPRSVGLIFSEHFIEHITRDQALRLMQDCHRALMPGGVLRLSTPDLSVLAYDYINGVKDRWASSGWAPNSPAKLLNEGMRLWGHQFLYDRPELVMLLQEAGFRSPYECMWGASSTPALCRLEARPYHCDLIVEVIR